MKSKLIVAATAALLMSPFAMANDQAAPQASEESCASLQSKFDKDVMTSQSTNVGQAQSKREQGAKLCSEGRSAEGIAKLKEAITELKAAAPAKPQT